MTYRSIEPCANCGHTEFHCEMGGCMYYDSGERQWCDCMHYCHLDAPPDGKPMRAAFLTRALYRLRGLRL